MSNPVNKPSNTVTVLSIPVIADDIGCKADWIWFFWAFKANNSSLIGHPSSNFLIITSIISRKKKKSLIKKIIILDHLIL